MTTVDLVLDVVLYSDDSETATTRTFKRRIDLPLFIGEIVLVDGLPEEWGQTNETRDLVLDIEAVTHRIHPGRSTPNTSVHVRPRYYGDSAVTSADRHALLCQHLVKTGWRMQADEWQNLEFPLLVDDAADQTEVPPS